MTDYDFELEINPGQFATRIAVTPKGDLIKPSGMTEAEAIVLVALVCLGHPPLEEAKFMKATWEKWTMKKESKE